MPWQKNFNEEEALERAMKVFWAKGFEATSVRDLVHAMGINKGSLYNAFGSKKELFTRAFLKYDRANRQAAIAHLEGLDDPVTAIGALFDGLIAETEGDVEKKGCLLVNTALELPGHAEDTQRLVSAALEDFERFFERMIRKGQERGDVPATVDPADAATSLMTLVVGLRVLARGAYTPERLQAIRAQALESLAA